MRMSRKAIPIVQIAEPARSRSRSRWPILNDGFRPFFLSAAALVVLAVPIWVAALSGLIDLPVATDPLAWHKHEMTFGYLGAVMAGFLLTAIPNWTGRLPLAGAPLAVFFGLWLLGRIAMAASALTGLAAAAAIDLLFPVALAVLVAREVVAGRNWRNLPVCLLVAGFALADGLAQLDYIRGWNTGMGERLALGAAATLIALIGGRIVPSFTRNWLVKRGATTLPAPFGRFDRATLAVTAPTLASWALWPEAPWSGAALLLIGLVHAARFARWQGWSTGAEPLVLILHLGYAWLPLGFLLMGVAAFAPEAVPTTAALHALTAGAIGTMTMAVMTRATLGHTGRELTAGRGTAAIYAAILTGAVLRVATPFLPIDPTVALTLAGGLWSLGFLLFVAIYGPMMFRARGAQH
jgi:uncharacterized protein involved in response to NO